MAEQKDVQSSSPAKASKLQLALEQSLTVECWNPPKNDTHIQQQRKSYSEMIGHKVLVTQLCQSLCNAIEFSPPASTIHGIFQARILEWVASSFFRGSSHLRDFPDPGIKPTSSILQADALPSELPRKSNNHDEIKSHIYQVGKPQTGEQKLQKFSHCWKLLSPTSSFPL